MTNLLLLLLNCIGSSGSAEPPIVVGNLDLWTSGPDNEDLWSVGNEVKWS